MKRYCIETYGCQMNVADSELIAGLLEAAGWRPASGPTDADLIVVNTCSVRERAVERITGRVNSLASLKAHNPRLRIVLAGCVPQHLGAELADALPDVDLFIGPDAYRRLPGLVDDARAVGGEGPAPAGGRRMELRRDRDETYADLAPVRRKGVHAWVSIMRGCDRFCTYCAVPFGRGRERSLPAGVVEETVGRVLAEGYRAVTLLGQAVTSYRDHDHDFAWLLGRLCGLAGLRHLRFLAPHPTDVGPPLLERMASSPVIARHLHLPLQSGSNRVLAAMRRGYTRERYLEIVRLARRLVPEVGITTDLLVGFPGESEADFRETLALMDEVRFDGAFMFAYSPRKHTYAARFLEDDVAPAEKQRRLSEVIEVQERHALERFSAHVGQRRSVLVEGRARASDGCSFGRCDDFKPVIIELNAHPAPAPGERVDVEVTAATSHTLRGRIRTG